MFDNMNLIRCDIINKIRKTWNLKSRFAMFESLDPANLLISDGQLFSVFFEREYGEF
jgi:hypothetical protein